MKSLFRLNESLSSFFVNSLAGALLSFSFILTIQALRILTETDFFPWRNIASLISVTVTTFLIVNTARNRSWLYGLSIPYTQAILNAIFFIPKQFLVLFQTKPLIAIFPPPILIAGLVGMLMAKLVQSQQKTFQHEPTTASNKFYNSDSFYLFFATPFAAFILHSLGEGLLQGHLYFDWLVFLLFIDLIFIYHTKRIPTIVISSDTLTHSQTIFRWVVPLNQITSIEHKNGGNFFDKYGSLNLTYNKNGKQKKSTILLGWIDNPKGLIESFKRRGFDI